MTYAAYKCDLQRMQYSVLETAIQTVQVWGYYRTCLRITSLVYIMGCICWGYYSAILILTPDLTNFQTLATAMHSGNGQHGVNVKQITC